MLVQLCALLHIPHTQPSYERWYMWQGTLLACLTDSNISVRLLALEALQLVGTLDGGCSILNALSKSAVTARVRFLTISSGRYVRTQKLIGLSLVSVNDAPHVDTTATNPSSLYWTCLLIEASRILAVKSAGIVNDCCKSLEHSLQRLNGSSIDQSSLVQWRDSYAVLFALGRGHGYAADFLQHHIKHSCPSSQAACVALGGALSGVLVSIVQHLEPLIDDIPLSICSSLTVYVIV